MQSRYVEAIHLSSNVGYIGVYTRLGFFRNQISGRTEEAAMGSLIQTHHCAKVPSFQYFYVINHWLFDLVVEIHNDRFEIHNITFLGLEELLLFDCDDWGSLHVMTVYYEMWRHCLSSHENPHKLQPDVVFDPQNFSSVFC